MNINRSYKKTTSPDTVVYVTFVENYQDGTFKEQLARYKFDIDFSKNWHMARTRLRHILYDMCTDIKFDPKNLGYFILYTSPPSTMYHRREKILNTTQDLFRDIFCWHKIFGVHRAYLRQHKAQHIDGARKTRTNQKQKYYIPILTRLYFWFIFTIQKQHKVCICIIDDVATTGATLRDCRDVLCTYLESWKKKKPEIIFQIQVFSIAH